MNILFNYLSWSEQRAKSIHTCPRQYAYKYLQAWSGWEADEAPEKQQAYYLNCVLADLRIATGNILHDRAGRILRRIASGMTIVPAKEIAIAEEDFDRFIINSQKLALTSLSGKRKKLLCHLLGEALPDALVKSERESISTMLGHFFALPELALFTAEPSCLLSQFIEADMGPPTHELGVPARLMTDAVFTHDGITVVCDWKTGKPRPEHREKGMVYDVFVRGRLGLGPGSRVQVRFLYLRTGEREEFEFTEEERQETRWRVGEDFALMQEKSSDPVLNIADPDSFPAVTGFHCLSCPHQLMCRRFAADAARGFFDRFQNSEVAS
jgi:hypothetical protein